jgi:TetR/AcrR family transcriptional regulator, upper aerobic nicotinate degradation pathway regulator
MSKSTKPPAATNDKALSTTAAVARKKKVQAGTGRAIGRPPSGARESILGAAILEFAEVGFGGARVERISKRANTSDRMLYYHFDSKDALFQAALEQVHEDMITAESAIELHQVDPREGMKRLIAFIWRYFEEHPQFISMVNIENMYAARHAMNSERIRSNAIPALRLVADLLERGVTAGYFRRDVTLFEIHLTIVSLCYYYLSKAATMSNFHGYDMMRPEARDAWLTHITRVVMDFLTEREPKNHGA